MPADALRRHARLLMWLVTIPLAGFVLILAAVVGNVAWQGGRYADIVAIIYPPMLLYGWAIWTMRRALRAVADGEEFGAGLLWRVGLALFGGAILTVFAVPLLTWWRFGHPFVQTFDGSAVTLGVAGAVLAVVGRLAARASAMRAELDGFV